MATFFSFSEYVIFIILRNSFQQTIWRGIVLHQIENPTSAFEIDGDWIETLRYLLVGPSTLKLSWRLDDRAFDCGMVDDARYMVERRAMSGEWTRVSEELSELHFFYHYLDVAEENWFRVVPLMQEAKGNPSRAVRINVQLSELPTVDLVLRYSLNFINIMLFPP